MSIPSAARSRGNDQPPAATSRRDSQFLWFTLLLVGVVIAGFTRTYYLREIFYPNARPLSVLVHWHGVVMTLWFGLFALQILLVRLRHRRWHQRLGWTGMVLVAVMVTLSAKVATGLAASELRDAPRSAEPALLLALQVFCMLGLFCVFTALGVQYRRVPEVHKRWMTLAMLSLLGPAVTRLPFLPNHNVPVAAGVNIGLILLVIAVDWRRARRLHPTFGWGGLALIGSIFVVAPLSLMPWWQQLVRQWLL